jgi:hypothetical protein
MDPAIPTPKRRDRRIVGIVCLLLLLTAAVTAAFGWLTSLRAQDPGDAYRLAVFLGAGAVASGVLWLTWVGMEGAPETAGKDESRRDR